MSLEKEIKIENAVGLASSWIDYARKVRAFFANDPDVRVEYDFENNDVILYVNGTAKADALTQLLSTEKVFGNVTLGIKIIPANKLESKVFGLLGKKNIFES